MNRRIPEAEVAPAPLASPAPVTGPVIIGTASTSASLDKMRKAYETHPGGLTMGEMVSAVKPVARERVSFQNGFADQAARGLSGVRSMAEKSIEEMGGRVLKYAKAAFEGIARQKQQDLAYFFQELVRREQDCGTNFQQEFLEEAWPEKGCDEAVLQALQAAMQTSDPKILGALAHMTADYHINDKKPDIFFRGFTRLTEQVGRSEIDSLGEWFGKIHELKEQANEPAANVLISESKDDDKLFTKFNLCREDRGTITPIKKESQHPGGIPEGLDSVLAGTGLARAVPGGGGYGPASHYLSVTPGFAEKLNRYINS